MTYKTNPDCRNECAGFEKKVKENSLTRCRHIYILLTGLVSVYDLKVEVSIGIKVERATEYIKASIHCFQTLYNVFKPMATVIL